MHGMIVDSMCENDMGVPSVCLHSMGVNCLGVQGVGMPGMGVLSVMHEIFSEIKKNYSWCPFKEKTVSFPYDMSMYDFWQIKR